MALSGGILPLFIIGCKIAENPRGSQGAVVREVALAQMPRELPDISRWLTHDVLGSPPIFGQEYLDELKLSGIIFGGGDLKRRYRVEVTRPGDRVCYLNLDHPRVPNWLWVNEVMFIEFGIMVLFSNFQQKLLNCASITPSQLHPNAWSAIRCFELVTEFLELPPDPEVFLYLFTFFSLNTEGKTKKGYMSVRPGKYRKFFEGQGRFPSYWSSDADMDYVPVTYRGLNAEQKDTADILVKLFSERNLKPKSVLGRQSEALEAIGHNNLVSCVRVLGDFHDGSYQRSVVVKLLFWWVCKSFVRHRLATTSTSLSMVLHSALNRSMNLLVVSLGFWMTARRLMGCLVLSILGVNSFKNNSFTSEKLHIDLAGREVNH
ncbi:hypothetical protein PIB30_038537 [Stylosanthes scabra]|uniref:Uncharacterized protein n=1 Tax=Stylosanthes scabra TaxID=79078 RepID=A0ABU6WDS2_9FABA|nr:hypothetical protein [Stylosanthes scabra]